MILTESDLIKNPDIDRSKEYILCHHVLYNWNTDLACDFFYICEDTEVVAKLQHIFEEYNAQWEVLLGLVGGDSDILTENDFEYCFIRWHDDGWADDCSHSSNVRFAGDLTPPKIIGYVNPSKSGFRDLSHLITKDRMGYMYDLIEIAIGNTVEKIKELNQQ